MVDDKGASNGSQRKGATHRVMVVVVEVAV